MRCEEAKSMIDAYIDGELAPERAAELESHAGSCASCARLIADRRALISATSRLVGYHAAPDDLRASISRSLEDGIAAPARARVPAWSWLSLAAAVVLLGVCGWLALGRAGSGRPGDLVQEAVSAHIRALMASHLLDVASTRQHTVKPWFAGKIDFAPHVVDFADRGFPLTGGRLDYLGGRPAAAIVYARNSHTINLFVSLIAQGATAIHAQDDRGYHSRSWSEGGMWYCAVSDVNDTDLGEFAALVRSADTESPEPKR